MFFISAAFMRFRHCEAWDGDGVGARAAGGDFLYFVIGDKRAGSFVSRPHGSSEPENIRVTVGES